MLTIDIFHISSLLVVAIMFFMYETKHLLEPMRTKVKNHLVAYWFVAVVVLLSSFIALEMGG